MLFFYAIYNFIIKERHINKIYPTWFITFVGPAVVTVTAINYNLETLGLIYFYFSYINYLVLLPFVLYRVYKYKHYKDGDYPTITVFSAPGGLLLASYMIGVTQKSNIILAILIPLTILLFIFVLIQLPYLLKRKFYPSFSAFYISISDLRNSISKNWNLLSNNRIFYFEYFNSSN